MELHSQVLGDAVEIVRGFVTIVNYRGYTYIYIPTNMGPKIP
jgi:hypothetical protein